VISGFFCGGLAGAVAFRFCGAATLCIPATLTGLAAIGYGLYQFIKSRRN